jgi:ribosome biogenesis GTPase / thiamine phosphate phosphatase
VDDLTTLGWDAQWSEAFEQFKASGLVPGRVAVQHRGAWDVLTEFGELRVDATGRLRHDASSTAELPVVGDWVAVATRSDENGGTIQAVLPRRTKVSRKTAWQATEEQVLVANVDVIFLVTSVNEDLNLRRLERYLTLAWESGASPAFVLTKADLLVDVTPAVAIVESIAFGVPVLAISSATGVGIEQVRELLPAGATGAFIGSSTRSPGRSCSRRRRSARTAAAATRRCAAS